MARKFIVPGKIINGAGALETSADLLVQLGKKALIVTDKVMIELENCAKVEEILKKRQLEYTVYSEINGEPTDKMIMGGVKKYNEEKCDFLIALGGGSPIDSMKAIGSLVLNNGKITDYMGKDINVKMPPMVAIPTTAGTGSEATQFTMTAPPKITAATGLDALCHAVEAYTSKKSQALSDSFALSAVKRIFTYLPIAFANGKQEEARVQMSIAALEAGIAFNNSSVTLIHRIQNEM